MQAGTDGQNPEITALDGAGLRVRLAAAISGSLDLLLHSDEFPGTIQQMFATVGEAANIQRVRALLRRLDPESGKPFHELLHEWWAEGLESQGSAGATRLDDEDLGADHVAALLGGTMFCLSTAHAGARIEKLLQAAGSRATLAAPVIARGAYRGLIAFDDCRAERIWSPEERDALGFAASAMGTIIYRRELERGPRAAAAASRRIGKFLEHTVMLLSQSTDLNSPIAAILGGLAMELGAFHAFLFRHDAATDTIRLELAYLEGTLRPGMSGEEMPLFAAPFSSSITPAWRIMSSTKGLFTPEMSPIPAEQFGWPGFEQYARRFGVSDMGHIILFVGDQPVGSIGFSLRDGRRLSPADRHFVEMLANQAAAALRMADIGEQAKLAAVSVEREVAARERMAELRKSSDAMKEILDAVAFGQDLNKILERILAVITRQLGSNSSALCLVDEDTGVLRLHAVFEQGCIKRINGGDGSDWSEACEQGLLPACERHIRERQPVLYAAGELTVSGAPASVAPRGVKALLGVPLLLRSDIVGSFLFGFCHSRTMTPGELELTQALAHQATMVIQLTALARSAGDAALNEERARLARDIHDTLAQGFTGILMQLGAASQTPGDSRRSIQPQIDAITALARASLTEARRSVRALRFDNQVAARLDQRIEQLAERFRLQTRSLISVKLNGDAATVSLAQANELFGMIRESVQNAIKHARAREIAIQADFQDAGAVTVSIRDDGQGFDTAQAAGPDSFGLLGMQERATLIGASLTVISEEGLGTEVIIRCSPSAGAI